MTPWKMPTHQVMPSTTAKTSLAFTFMHKAESGVIIDEILGLWSENRPPCTYHTQPM